MRNEKTLDFPLPAAGGLTRFQMLEQSRIWADAKGTVWQVPDMSAEHRENLLLFFEEAAFLFQAHTCRQLEAEGESGAKLARILRRTDPVSWIRSRPLYAAVRLSLHASVV